MKKIAFVFLCFLLSPTLHAQPPQAFKYQAVMRDPSGAVMASQAVELRVSIHNETPTGAIIYQEIYNTTTNAFGLVQLNIGLGPSTIGQFTDINWNADAKFLEVELGDGSGDYLSLGTSEIFAVPYALYSKSAADSYWGLYNSNIYYNSGNVGIRTTTPDADLHVADRIRVGEDPDNANVYGELYHLGGGTGFILNSHAGGGTWADMYFQTNGTTRMFIESEGNVGIGTMELASGYRLSVDGKVACEEVLVDYSGSWPDYVFHEGYDLPSLESVEASIRENKRLPGLPPAEEVNANGFQVAEMQKQLLEKVEELMLYTIEQGKQIRELQAENSRLKEEVGEIKRLHGDK